MNQEDEEHGLKKLWSGFLKKMNVLCLMHATEEYVIRRVFLKVLNDAANKKTAAFKRPSDYMLRAKKKPQHLIGLFAAG